MTYTLLRIVLLAAAFGALYVVGLRGWLLVLVAAVLAFTLSYLLLRRQRDSAAQWLADRSARARAGDPEARGFSRGALSDADTEDQAVDSVVDAAVDPARPAQP